MKRYLYAMSDRAIKPRSVMGRVNALRGFASYLVSQGYAEGDPCRTLRTPKLDAPKQDIVQDDEARALLDACDRIADRRRATQSRAILSVLLYGGPIASALSAERDATPMPCPAPLLNHP